MRPCTTEATLAGGLRYDPLPALKEKDGALLWGIRIPDTTNSGEQLPLAFDIPTPAEAREAAQRRRGRRKQPPLRVCGQCTGTFRSWGADRLCGRCLEDGSARPPAAASSQLATLPGETFEDIFGGAA